MIKTNPVNNPTPEKLAKTVEHEIVSKAHRIQDYPRPARIATVKALKQAQYSSKKISEILGMSESTVQAYVDAQIEDEWERYSSAVSKILIEKKDTLRALTNNAIQVKLKDTDKLQLRDLTGLYRVLNESERALPHQANLIQTINVHPALERRIVVNEDL